MTTQMDWPTCHVCIPTHRLGHDCIIPEARCYVVSQCSESGPWFWRGKVNLCVVPCHDGIEAQMVLIYVRTRADQKRARIVYRRPRRRDDRVLTCVPSWRERAHLPAWKPREKGAAR